MNSNSDFKKNDFLIGQKLEFMEKSCEKCFFSSKQNTKAK
jgi:hypothetical protein